MSKYTSSLPNNSQLDVLSCTLSELCRCSQEQCRAPQRTSLSSPFSSWLNGACLFGQPVILLASLCPPVWSPFVPCTPVLHHGWCRYETLGSWPILGFLLCHYQTLKPARLLPHPKSCLVLPFAVLSLPASGSPRYGFRGACCILTAWAYKQGALCSSVLIYFVF